jgi:hypothetical protein
MKLLMPICWWAVCLPIILLAALPIALMTCAVGVFDDLKAMRKSDDHHSRELSQPVP